MLTAKGYYETIFTDGGSMNKRTKDKHSINCYFCNVLADERECLPADNYNEWDGGDICPKCQKDYKFKILHDTLCTGWVDFEHDGEGGTVLYDTFEEAQAELTDFMEEFGSENEDGDGGYDESEFQIVAVHRKDWNEKAKI